MILLYFNSTSYTYSLNSNCICYNFLFQLLNLNNALNILIKTRPNEDEINHSETQKG